MQKHWKIKPWIIFTVLAIFLVSVLYFVGKNYVNNPISNSYDSAGESYAPSMAPGAAMTSKSMELMASDAAYDTNSSRDISSTETADRKIIKTGFLSIVVDDVRESAKTITKYVEENGGFLVSSNINKSGIDLYGEITVRVPSEIFETAFESFKEIGDVESEYVDGRDITEEYTDLEAQLKNLKATEEQFLSIMKSAKKIEDILAVQKELMYVRENIERLEGQIKYLSESAALSSITINLSTNPSTLPVVNEEDKWKPLAIIKDAVRSLIAFGIEIVNGLIWVVVYLPIVLVLLFIAWIIRRYFRRKHKK
jgi:hypothetical protein